VKVTLVPEQMVVADAEMLTAGVTLGLTVILIELDVAEVGATHAALDVITQLTTSPFAKALLVYVELLLPTLPPFNFH
jgi:hypothetical protein